MPQVKVLLISRKICKNSVKHVKHVEKSYWKTDRTIDTKLDKLQIALDNKDDNSEYNYSTEEEKDDQTVYSGFLLNFLFSCLKNFTIVQILLTRFSPIKMISYTLINKIIAKSLLYRQ